MRPRPRDQQHRIADRHDDKVVDADDRDGGAVVDADEAVVRIDRDDIAVERVARGAMSHNAPHEPTSDQPISTGTTAAVVVCSITA